MYYKIPENVNEEAFMDFARIAVVSNRGYYLGGGHLYTEKDIDDYILNNVEEFMDDFLEAYAEMVEKAKIDKDPITKMNDFDKKHVIDKTVLKDKILDQSLTDRDGFFSIFYKGYEVVVNNNKGYSIDVMNYELALRKENNIWTRIINLKLKTIEGFKFKYSTLLTFLEKESENNDWEIAWYKK